MATRKVEEINPYTKELDAIVVNVAKNEKGKTIILDQTIFFPEGGGQPCDLGTIQSLPLFDVYEKEGLIYHNVKESDSSNQIKTGDKVHLILDWNRRFDHMQRHCGEHILSGVFFHLYGAVNCGFHMGEDNMTIDMNLEESNFSRIGCPSTITWEMAMIAEEEANKAIWANLPITTRQFSSKNEAESLPLRKALTIENNIRIVCVGDPNSPTDCVACCGTHPAYSGEVGLIKILKLENYKGMTRVHFEAGMRGYKKLQEIYNVSNRLGLRFSTPIEQLEEKIKSFEEKNQKSKEELYHIKKSIISERQEEIRSALNEGILIRKYSDLKTEDLMALGRGLIKDIPKLLFIISEEENTLLLFSNNATINCGNLVKENAPIYNGKGGGNKESARALFPSNEYLDTFIDLIEKHLR